MFHRLSKRALIIIISLIIIVVGIVIYSIVFSAWRSTTGTLDLLVAPTQATISINGKTYKNGTHYLSPGNYTAEISMDGFDSKTFDISITTGNTTNLHTYLNQTDGSDSWYSSHPEDLSIVTRISDAEANAEADSYNSRYPVIQALPIIYANYSNDYETYTEFRIDGGEFTNCKRQFCIKITDTTGGNRDHALQLIEQAGYNPNDYEILYEYTPIKPLN